MGGGDADTRWRDEPEHPPLARYRHWAGMHEAGTRGTGKVMKGVRNIQQPTKQTSGAGVWGGTVTGGGNRDYLRYFFACSRCARVREGVYTGCMYVCTRYGVWFMYGYMGVDGCTANV